MKILHIGKYYPPYFGGIEKVNFDLVETLNEHGNKTDILCFNHQTHNLFENKNYKIFRVSTLASAFSSPVSISIFRILKKIHSEYDIIHIHVPNPMGAIALQSVPFEGKIVVHWHSDIIKQRFLKRIYNPFQDKLLKRADKIIVTTPNYLEGSGDLKPYRDKCSIIPIGISNSEFKDNMVFRNELYEIYKGKKVIFSIGRLIYYKGFEYLIEAANDLPDDYVILIGGTGNLKNKLKNRIQTNDLQSKVILLGQIPFERLGEYYRRADVFCLPSIERSEAFGVVLIEAMSWGCPIVSTNIVGSGVPWVNKNNESGFVVEPCDSKALAKAIIEICSNKSLSDQFSDNAKKRYKTLFELNDMCNSTIQLYEELLSE